VEIHLVYELCIITDMVHVRFLACLLNEYYKQSNILSKTTICLLQLYYIFQSLIKDIGFGAHI